METNRPQLGIIKSYSDQYEVARRYYSILFMLNDISLSPHEMNMVAFAAVRGCLSTRNAREEYVIRYCEGKPTSKYIFYNIKAKLQRKGFLVKRDKKTYLHPSLLLDVYTPSLRINLQLNDNANRTPQSADSTAA